jgi:hypothetical protein
MSVSFILQPSSKGLMAWQEDKQGPRVIFCVPGRSFSPLFLESWTNLVGYCIRAGIQFAVSGSRVGIANLFDVRNLCLGGHVSKGENQKPFNGEVNYTHLMWIDSDIIFNQDQFQRLLNRDRDIISGLYHMAGPKQEFAAVRELDNEYFSKNFSFQYLRQSDIDGHSEPLEVSYAGLGFMLIKKGVVEALTYPWFRPLEQRVGNLVDIYSEDVSFCLRVREAGFKIFVDPTVILGHEKTTIL